MIKDEIYKVSSMECPKCPACFMKTAHKQQEGFMECSRCGTIFLVECEITYYTKIRELGKKYNLDRLPFSLGDKVTLRDGAFLSSVHENIKCDEKKCWGIITNINFSYYIPLYVIDWVVEPEFYGNLFSFISCEMKKFEGENNENS